jgi:hypothetical protein
MPVLYHLSASTALFALVILEIGSYLLPNLAWTTMQLVTVPSIIAGVTSVHHPISRFFHWDGVSHQMGADLSLLYSLGWQTTPPCPAIVWNGIYLMNFCPSWPWTTRLLISVSQEARITGMSH